MESYHIRRKDKEIKDTKVLESILTSQRYMTVAMCRDGEPYLVTLNHGYDPEKRCIYFHCAGEGKKLDFLRANPRVWGQALEDLGYIDGECEHAYRCVMFSGKAGFLEKDEEKRIALEVMIRQHESEPEKVMARVLKPDRIWEVTIGVIEIEEITGKQATE